MQIEDAFSVIVERGIVGSVESPDTLVSRGDAIVMLYKVAGNPAFRPVWDPPFQDVPPWHRCYIPLAYAYSVFSAGQHSFLRPQTFSPDDYLTNEVAAVWSHAFLGVKSEAEILDTGELVIASTYLDAQHGDSVEWAVSRGALGSTNGIVDPSEWITYEFFARLLYLVARSRGRS